VREGEGQAHELAVGDARVLQQLGLDAVDGGEQMGAPFGLALVPRQAAIGEEEIHRIGQVPPGGRHGTGHQGAQAGHQGVQPIAVAPEVGALGFLPGGPQEPHQERDLRAQGAQVGKDGHPVVGLQQALVLRHEGRGPPPPGHAFQEVDQQAGGVFAEVGGAGAAVGEGPEGRLEGGFEGLHHGGLGQRRLAGCREGEEAAGFHVGSRRDLLLDGIDLAVRVGQPVQALAALDLDVVLDAVQVGGDLVQILHAPDLDLQALQEVQEANHVGIVRPRGRRDAHAQQACEARTGGHAALEALGAAPGLQDVAVRLLQGLVPGFQADLLGPFILLDQAPGQQLVQGLAADGLQAHRLGGGQGLQVVEPERGGVHGGRSGPGGARALAWHRPDAAGSQEWTGFWRSKGVQTRRWAPGGAHLLAGKIPVASRWS